MADGELRRQDDAKDRLGADSAVVPILPALARCLQALVDRGRWNIPLVQLRSGGAASTVAAGDRHRGERLPPASGYWRKDRYQPTGPLTEATRRDGGVIRRPCWQGERAMTIAITRLELSGVGSPGGQGDEGTASRRMVRVMPHPPPPIRHYWPD
jgi:hypothetical protein